MNPFIPSERPAAATGAAFLMPESPVAEEGTDNFTSFLERKGMVEPKRERRKEEENGESTPIPTWIPFAVLQRQVPAPETQPLGSVAPRASGLLEPPHPAGPLQIQHGEVPSAQASQQKELPTIETQPASGQGLALEGFTPVTEAESAVVSLTSVLPLRAPQAGQKVSGMAVAQQDSMLSRSEKPNEIAAGPEQNLPEASFFALDVEFSAASIQPVPVRLPREQRGEPLAPLANQTDLPPPEMPIEQVLGPAPVAEIDFSLVDSIKEHIQFLRAGSADSLELTLNPNPETELFLHVEKVDGQISILVRLEKGNFADLEFQWPQLQQTLAVQGIKLDNLATGSGLGSFSAHDQQGSNQPEPSEVVPPSGHPNFPQQQKNENQRHAATPASGWQSWA